MIKALFIKVFEQFLVERLGYKEAKLIEIPRMG
jgi:hypothetical protein